MSNRTPYSECPLLVQFLRRDVKNSRSESAYARHDVSMNWPSFSGAAHGGEAYPKMPTKHLHRDVVVGDEDMKVEKLGILVHCQWDHASKMKQEEKYEHHSFRTGTWPFMSIALLKDPSKVHEILDDLEALFWTLLYTALHRFEYTGAFSISIFNYRRFELLNGVPTGRIVGGSEKGGALSDIPIIIDFTCQPLQNTITALSEALADYYHYFWNAMRSKKVADKDPKNIAAKKRYDSARKKFDEHHTILSEPSYWRKLFKEELNTKDAWPECDVAPTAIHSSSESSSSDDEDPVSPSRSAYMRI